MKPLFRIVFVLVIVLGFLHGCSHQKLAKYEEFAAFVQPGTNKPRLPVIIVPGVKGSKLNRGDEEIWGRSCSVAFLNTFDELQFPITAQLEYYFSSEFSRIYKDRNVRDGGIMQNYRIAMPFVNLLDIRIYRDLRDVLEESGGYSKNRDLFLFSYDWRLDNRISAAHLAYRVKQYQRLYMKHLKEVIFNGNGQGYNEYIQRLDANQRLTGDGLVKVNLIAHSMGGLISRYYLQVLGGEKNVNKLIMLGTPNQGAMDALKAIAEGEYPESVWHFYPKEKTRPIIFSWPSTFQLLPRYQGCLKKGDWHSNINLNDWGLGRSYPDDTSDGGNDLVIENWKNHNLIPAGLYNSENDTKTLTTYLKEQLVSAAKFHGAINGAIDKEYEARKLESIRTFSDKVVMGVLIEANFLDCPVEIPFILFGGHCEPTLKYACCSKTKDNQLVLNFDNPEEKEEKEMPFTMGDGRVPIASLRIADRTNASDFQFLMCEGHTSMISSSTFQYNLLRELLWQASCIR